MDQNLFLNNLTYEKNNDILYNITKQLENIINDLNSDKKIHNIINQIKNIIIIMNKVIHENKKNTEMIRKDIKKLRDTIANNFKTLYYVGKKNMKMVNMLENLKMD